jgi:tRNA U34 5-carboxymethylaminomethyl modifying enzyme MnmG/GidA
LDTTRLKRSDVAYASLSSLLNTDLGDSITLSQLAHRQGVTPELVQSLLPGSILDDCSLSDLQSVLADSLYEGYIEAQKSTAERISQHDWLRVPEGFDYGSIIGLSHEMVERLERARPVTFGQARRIPGMTPAALSNLLVYLTIKQKAA